MKKSLKKSYGYVYKEKSHLGHYKAEAFVVRCVDNRFWKAVKHFIKKKKIKHVDPKSPAGGAKVFSSPFKKSDLYYYLNELKISINLHHVDTVMLFTHHDCGAYGGFGNFDNNEEKEFTFHLKEHKKAVKVIKKYFPKLKIETYFHDDVGIIRTL